MKQFQSLQENNKKFDCVTFLEQQQLTSKVSYVQLCGDFKSVLRKQHVWWKMEMCYYVILLIYVVTVKMMIEDPAFNRVRADHQWWSQL